jgi:hypothetical protein
MIMMLQVKGVYYPVTKSGTNEFAVVLFSIIEQMHQVNSTIQGQEEVDSTTPYGLSLGGPIVKKITLFMVYERQDVGDPQFIANIQ